MIFPSDGQAVQRVKGELTKAYSFHTTCIYMCVVKILKALSAILAGLSSPLKSMQLVAR